MKCDFCSAPDPVWCFPAISFLVLWTPRVREASDGNWAACEECARLINKNDRVNLSRRSQATLQEARGILVPLEAFFELHQQFFDHRCGHAVPIERTKGAA